MFNLREVIYQNDNIDKHGQVELGSSYEKPKHNPLWLLALRWLVLTVAGSLLYGIGLHIMLQAQWPLWKGVLLLSGALMIYIGLSFFIRPNANYQNLGAWGGLINDPTQYSDNVNRNLVEMEYMLAPGQFVAETVLDTAHYLGLVKTDEELL